MTPQPDPDEGVLFELPRVGDAAGAKRTTKAKPPKKRRPAADLPVARVLVDTPLPHLDRLFDYRVPDTMAESAVPGCRVRVYFNGQLLAGFLMERVAESDFQGRLAYLHDVVSSEVVLTPEIAELARAVADRYAGTLNDVLRLAIPPRHARVEKEKRPEEPGPPAEGTPEDDAAAAGTAETAAPDAEAAAAPGEDAPADAPEATPATAPAGAADASPAPDPGPWSDYPTGPSFLAALHAGGAPRAVWTALPGSDWADAVAVATATALAAGRGVVVVVPDGRDVATVDTALTARLGPDRHTALTAGLGPAERYRRWLSVLRGEVRAVVGTRAAMFAPVRDLGLVVLWDDGDDVHCDPHAPYPHARTVLSMRAHRAGAAALIGGFTRTTEATQLVESGWAHPLAADRATVRGRAPRVHAAGDDAELVRDEAARAARLPSLALRIAREAAQTGPVLVQVPRRGYLVSLACASCRAPARCASCQGPLALRSAHAMPYCRWCGRLSGEWHCGMCRHDRVRANVVGARRTAEELGRAFPALTVRTSGRDEVLAEVDDRPALVVATPGAEPVAAGGYAAALLLDGWALLGRADLRAGEEALRRWLNAAALVRPAGDGGRVIVLAGAELPVTQALIRWDPAWFASRELAERRELGFPPAVAMASVTGEASHVHELLNGLDLPESAELLGPVPVTAGPDSERAGTGQVERALLRVPRADTPALTAALKAAASARSARKDDHLAQIRVDPLHVV
ncbi:primosomal protein N' (replication factor Y) [Nocardiopsis mwathae]|uniref:Probable replication restart protein PriA n=1 Tax=Nocardiopsis mwathae TaxID=1472723 RepID=A0A7X0D6X9_9ACTN|nr:primosomal protein N' [Nocardiopsis mwathae]MBB6172489.1 primosomal protein N' (replication factor Y) [Nocardiopsis mwathae]